MPRFRFSVLMLVALFLVPDPIFSQGGRGGIAGLVRDTSGALVPDAEITVVDQKTGVTQRLRSQSDGAFLAPQLLPATYKLTVEKPGFKRLTVDGLKVDTGTTVNRDITLEVGAVSESIQVTGQSSLVETTSGALGTTVRVTHVLEMPLSDRNVFTLVNLAPGSFMLGGHVSIGGGRPESQLALVDGVNNTRGGVASNGIEMSPPVDSMEEFKVEANSFSAEYGRAAGGLVSAVTKTGTNEFHGSFYEFMRNDLFDARGWSADEKAPLRRNNFGGTIGGPVIRNRTFFFYNYDGLRDRQAVTRTRNVGLPEWRTGNFSTATRDGGGRAVPVVIYDPETGTGTFANPRATTPFPGNVIPPNRLDPVAVKSIAYIPAPNRAPNNPFNVTGNWQENVIDSGALDYHTARVDHEWNEKTRMFARYILTWPEDQPTGYSKGYGVADPNGINQPTRHQNVAVNAVHLFSPTHFLNLTLGFNRLHLHRVTGDCCDTDYARLLGLPNVPGNAFPRFNLGTGTVPVTNIGGPGNANRIAAFTNSDSVASFTKIRDRHTLKYGVQYSRSNGNEQTSNQPSGIWDFNGQLTRGVQANGAAIANTGVNLADFLLGRANSLTINAKPTIGKRIQYWAGYFQDDWRVTSRLTLNLGLRYDTEAPISEVAGRMNNFDPYAPNPLAGTADVPAGALGVITFPNRNGQGKYLWQWHKKNFAPRFGFAYRVGGGANTVVRGGFGLFYGRSHSESTIQCCNLGFVRSYTVSAPVPFRLRDGPPANALDMVPESELTPTFGNIGTRFATSSVQFMDPYRPAPYAMNFNLTIQHEWKNVLFEVSYLGNLSRHAELPSFNINLIRPELLSRTEIPQRLRRPWSVFPGDQAQVNSITPSNWGVSNYHGITFKSERRLRNGIAWTIAYTFSRWIDNVPFLSCDNNDCSFGDNLGIQNLYNMRGEKSLSTNSIPHRIVLAPVVELPLGKGKRWLNRGGLLDLVAGGWQISTMGTLRSGAPFGVSVLNGPRDLLGDPAVGVLRADYAGSDLLSPEKGAPAAGSRGIQWLNPAAFAVPQRYTHGNTSRTLPGVYGPGAVHFNTMVAKNFRFRERWRIQFRWESFNAFNTPQLDVPNTSLGGNAFGLVAGAGGRRIMQFGLKLYW